MRIAALPLLALPLAAQTTINWRMGAGYCQPTGVTNASPPVVTCASDPGWQDQNAVVFTNFLVSGPAPSIVNGTKYVDRQTATTYAIYNDSGLSSPVTTPGAYLAATNQWAGKVGASATIPADPLARLLKPETLRALRCDVAGGCLNNIVVSGGTATASFAVAHGFVTGKPIGVWGSATSALNTSTGSVTVTVINSTSVSWPTGAANGTYVDAAVSAWAHDANPSWVAVNSSCNNVTSPRVPVEDGGGTEGGQHAACAIRYYVDRANTTARDKADQIIDNPEDLSYGTYACNEGASSYCNTRVGAVDYSRERLGALAYVVALRRASGLTLSATQRDKILNNNQLYGSSCTNPSPVSIGSVTASSTTLTGAGFTSLAVGGAIWIDIQLGEPLIIRSITNDTTLVVHAAPGNDGTASDTSGTGLYVRPWQSGDCGALYLTRHHNHTQLGDSQLMGGNGAVQITGTANWFHNLSTTAAYAEIMMNGVLADVDARAKDGLEQAWSITWDTVASSAMSQYGGGSSMGSAYDIQRGYFPTAYVGAVQLMSGQTLVGDWASSPWQYLHYGWNNGPFTGGSAGYGYASFYSEGTIPLSPNWLSRTGVVLQWATTAAKQYFIELIRQGCGGSLVATCYADNGYNGAWGWMLGMDAQLSPSAWSSLDTAAFLRNSNGDTLCAGAKWCLPDKYEMFMTRDSWSSTALRGQIISGTWESDHLTDEAGSEQWWFDYRTGPATQCFIGSDSSTCAIRTAGQAAGENLKSMIVLGAYTRKGTRSTATVAYRGSRADVAHIRADTRGVWTAAPTRADRDVIHFKSGEVMTFTRTDVEGSSGTIHTSTHFANNGGASEGTTTCEGSACATATALTAKIYSDDTVRRMISQSVFPVSSRSGIRVIDASNGTYTNGNGLSFRLKHCASSNGTSCTAATGLTAIEVRRVGGLADTALTLTAYNSGAWDGVQATGGSSTRVAMFATAAQTSMPAITSTATAEFFAMPFAPGTYTVFSGGTPVCSSLTVTAADGAIHCASVPAGAITVGNQPPSPGTSIRGGAIRGGVFR